MFNKFPAVDFSAFTAPVDFSAFAAPIQKIVDLNTATMTKAFEAQQVAAKNLMDLSQARTQAALEIKDVEGFVAFVTEQSEIAKSSVRELTENTQAAAKDAEAYFAQVQAIVTEGQEVVAKSVPAMKPVAKKAPAKKAA